MSKLNYNNIDVQRLLNVLNELFLKFKICSFISYKNLDENLDNIKTKITNEELIKDINDHYELLKKFYEKHIIIEEEDQNGKQINEEEEEREYDEDRQVKEKEGLKKEKMDLIGVEENSSDESKKLAYNCRKFCRKYYRDKEFLALIDEYKGQDPDIGGFIKNFEEVIVPHYQKKTKMTLEEEVSETHLNAVLRQKIDDLKYQIQTKTEKYEKLKKDREQFKQECQKKISEINTEIKKLKDNTTDKLNELISKHNEDLNKKKEENDKKLESLRREHERAIEDFNQKKSTDAGQEKALRDAYETQEKKYAAVIGEYDIDMQNNKKDLEEKNKEKEQLNAILENKKDELDTLENKYKVLQENFLLTQQKCKDVDYLNKVKERSVE
jgi:outer membrane murein-binding lipoprotein Lpp